MDFDAIYKNFSDQLEQLKIVQNKAFSNLDPKTYEKVQKYHIDINQVINKFKEGDSKAIDEFLKKYSKIDASNSKK